MLNGRWSFAAWLPFALASCAGAAYVFLALDDGLPMQRGPGGGGEGIFFLIVSFLRLLALLALVACFVLRPRREAWNAKAIVISTLLWGPIFVGVAVASRWTSEVTVSVRALHTKGQPLPGVHMDYQWSKRRPDFHFTEGRGTAVADANGIATFRVPAFWTLTVYGDKKLRPTHEVSIDGQESTLRILHSKDGRSDRNTYSTRARKASELNVSIEFDPPTDQ